jgi:tRNA (guanine-N7-)-methyltransferase
MRIRSFVRREGRLTQAQRLALDELWPCYAVADEQLADPAKAFRRAAPCCLEIGCGTGDVLMSLARQRPDFNFLGAEVYRPGLGRMLRALQATHCDNVRLIAADVFELLECSATAPWLDWVLMLFPDPWPKKRHHKRRLLDHIFLDALRPLLRSQARIAVATDWQDYAEQMLETLQGAGFVNLAGEGRFAPRPRWRALSRYEQRAMRLGHRVYELSFAVAN